MPSNERKLQTTENADRSRTRIPIPWEEILPEFGHFSYRPPGARPARLVVKRELSQDAMPIPRSERISLDATAHSRVVSRCVRRQFLCVVDVQPGRHYPLTRLDPGPGIRSGRGVSQWCVRLRGDAQYLSGSQPSWRTGSDLGS